MNFFHLRCEVPGGIGRETIYDKSIVPWKIQNLHMEFDGWLGAEIMKSQSALIVTKNLQKAMGFNFTGIYGYEDLYISKSDKFEILQPGLKLPKFERLLVGNNAFNDDIAQTYFNKRYNQLIISDNLRTFLNDFELGRFKITLVENSNEVPPDPFAPIK